MVQKLYRLNGDLLSAEQAAEKSNEFDLSAISVKVKQLYQKLDECTPKNEVTKLIIEEDRTITVSFSNSFDYSKF